MKKILLPTLLLATLLANGVTAQNFDAKNFVAQLPAYVTGHIETSVTGVRLVIERVASGTLLLLR